MQNKPTRMRGFINIIFLWVLAALIATHFVFFGHILLFAAAASPATGTSKVVFVGDSWAEYAGDLTLIDHCPTIAAFENRGVGGSTAREWQEVEGCDGTACSPAAAFDGDYTHAWVSIGGNDFIKNDCRPPEDFRNVLDTAFEDIAAAAGPGVKILTTGYGAAPSDEVCPPADVASGNAIIRTASEAMGWTHVDVLSSFGGSATEFSSSEFYADALHLNEDGYAHLWTLPKIQKFFECYTPKAYVEVGRACRPTEPSRAVWKSTSRRRAREGPRKLRSTQVLHDGSGRRRVSAPMRRGRRGRRRRAMRRLAAHQLQGRDDGPQERVRAPRGVVD